MFLCVLVRCGGYKAGRLLNVNNFYNSVCIMCMFFHANSGIFEWKYIILVTSRLTVSSKYCSHIKKVQWKIDLPYQLREEQVTAIHRITNQLYILSSSYQLDSLWMNLNKLKQHCAMVIAPVISFTRVKYGLAGNQKSRKIISFNWI